MMVPGKMTLRDGAMKILMIGSGPEQIGKTGTYDRFSVEACRFLRAEGHETVWVDNNPATLASGAGVADRVYLEPLTSHFLEKVLVITELFLGQEGLLIRLVFHKVVLAAL